MIDAANMFKQYYRPAMLDNPMFQPSQLLYAINNQNQQLQTHTINRLLGGAQNDELPFESQPHPFLSGFICKNIAKYPKMPQFCPVNCALCAPGARAVCKRAQ